MKRRAHVSEHAGSARPGAGLVHIGETLDLPRHGGYYAACSGGELVCAATGERTVVKPFSATDRSKRAADIVTASNDEHGIADFLDGIGA